MRASTAKLERKDLKLNVRCPSAVHLLKHNSFKKPYFEYKNNKMKNVKNNSLNIGENAEKKLMKTQ